MLLLSYRNKDILLNQTTVTLVGSCGNAVNNCRYLTWKCGSQKQMFNVNSLITGNLCYIGLFPNFRSNNQKRDNCPHYYTTIHVVGVVDYSSQSVRS